MGEILRRVWENLIARPTGPINFRLLIQPSVAIFFAARSGLKDVREGRPAFLWGVLFKPGHRDELLSQGWKDVGTYLLVLGPVNRIARRFLIGKRVTAKTGERFE